MEALKMTYTIHNLRNTFISNCFVRGDIAPVDIMHCAGHTDLRTTQKYIRDTRELSKGKVLELKTKGFNLEEAV